MPFCQQSASAFGLLSSHPVDLVPNNAHLSDGAGFSLLMALVSLPVSAFLCVLVENSCFWLPAVDSGKAWDCQLSDPRSLQVRSKK